MSWRREQAIPVPAAEAFDKSTVDHLKPLVKLLSSNVPMRKGELVAALVRHMTDSTKVRHLYEQLDPLAQKAVQEATHEPEGFLHRTRFIARHGQMPAF